MPQQRSERLLLLVAVMTLVAALLSVVVGHPVASEAGRSGAGRLLAPDLDPSEDERGLADGPGPRGEASGAESSEGAGNGEADGALGRGTSAPAADAPGAPDLPDAVPPQPGLYVYRANSGGEEFEATLRVTATGSGPGEVRHTETMDNGPDGRLENRVVWRPDGKYVEWSRFEMSPIGLNCDWEPDVLELRIPLRRGGTWNVDSSCDVQVGGRTLTLTMTGTWVVSGATRTHVAGEDLDVWVVEGSFTQVFDGPDGRFASDGEARYEVSPAHGLMVRAQERGGSSSPGAQSGDWSRQREILNLTPR